MSEALTTAVAAALAVARALRGVIDPELGCSIVDLGLVYGILVEGRRVRIWMTTTRPAGPAAAALKRRAEEAAGGVEGVESVEIDMTWMPPWSAIYERSSEGAPRVRLT